MPFVESLPFRNLCRRFVLARTSGRQRQTVSNLIKQMFPDYCAYLSLSGEIPLAPGVSTHTIHVDQIGQWLRARCKLVKSVRFPPKAFVVTTACDLKLLSQIGQLGSI